MDQSVELTQIALDELKGGNLFQSAYWARIKEGSWKALPFHFTSPAWSGDVLVLVRSFAPGISMAYVPFAFSQDVTQSAVEAFCEEVGKYLPKSTVLLRLDLDWQVSPMKSTPRLIPCKSSVQPLATVQVDLTRPFAFKDRVKRNLKKEHSISIQTWEGDQESFDEWYDTYIKTAQRDHFTARPKAYLHSFFDKADQDTVPVLHLAYANDVLCGGLLSVRYKGCETYLFGSSIPHDGKTSCGYSLQVQTMMDAREAGMKTYDLFGIGDSSDDGHLSSLTTFKTAFGGGIIKRPMTMDHLIHPSRAHLFRFLDQKRVEKARG